MLNYLFSPFKKCNKNICLKNTDKKPSFVTKKYVSLSNANKIVIIQKFKITQLHNILINVYKIITYNYSKECKEDVILTTLNPTV